MKKIGILLITFCLIFAASSWNIKAKDNRMDLFVNGGIMTEFEFVNFACMIGFNLDIHVGDLLMLSSEGYVGVNKFDFGNILILPSVLLNLKFGSFFTGAGIAKWFDVSGDITDFLLKINAGFKKKHIKLTAFIVKRFDTLFSEMIIGITFGYSFKVK